MVQRGPAGTAGLRGPLGRPAQYEVKMNALRTLAMASLLAFGATVVATPAFAGDKKEMKCDMKGKACKKGDDCKAENCKPVEKKQK